MTFELIGKHKATLTDVDPQSVKMGQTDTKPAVALSFKNTLANARLDMLDTSLLPFFYTKGVPAKQGAVEGVPPIAALTQLTQAALKLGKAFKWEPEQTGCTLSIYHGISDIPPIVLKEVITRKLQVDLLEGGTTDWYWVAYTQKDVDADIMGQLGVLKSHDLEIELTAPEQLSQKPAGLFQGGDGDDDDPGFQTPESALAKSVAKANGVTGKKH